MPVEISLDNIEGDDSMPLIAPVAKEASVETSPPVPEVNVEAEAEPSAQEDKRETVPVPDYSITHEDFRALSAAQTAHANRVKIEQLALQHPEVRELLESHRKLSEETAKRKRK